MNWKSYSEARPEAEGVYLWRLPSPVVKDAVVRFYAKFTKRWCGYRDEVHPIFGHWNGYNIIVPANLQWVEVEDFPLNRHNGVDASLTFEGLSFSACPFCGKVPRLASIKRISGGTSLTAEAFHHNVFWLECCDWGQTPHVADPFVLEARRAEVFASIREATP
jgi:hypothetical protein